MHILKTNQHASDYKLGFSFVEALFTRLVIPDIAASYEVCHQIDVLVVHKRVKHVDQEPHKVYVESDCAYGCLSCAKSFLSLSTEFTDFLVTILALDISFMAYIVLNFLRSTFHTLPKPPFPITL